MPITQRYLKQILHYDRGTGVFTWLITKGHYVKVGMRAGSVYNNGYRVIRIDRKAYLTSRLAWFYIIGRWPTKDLDHKNRVRDDDRFNNLREVTRSQSTHNRRFKKNKLGQNIYPIGKRYRVRFNFKRKMIHVGSFNTLAEAIAARNHAAKRLYGNYSPF